MKKHTIIFFILLVLLFAYNKICAQDTYKFPTKFLSFDNARLAIGGGLDIAPSTLDMIQANFSQGISIPKKQPHAMGNFGFYADVYSPNSLIGFQTGISWLFRDFYLDNANAILNNQQYFNLKYFCIPIYIKIRPGNHLAKCHFLSMIGGSINIPLKAEVSLDSFSTVLISDKNILNTVFVPEATVGLEISFSKSPTIGKVEAGNNTGSKAEFNSEFGRLYLFVKGGFCQQNTFNPNFKWMGYSPTNDWNFKNHYISFGIIAYLRLTPLPEKMQ